jgi:hypothetical protein
MSVHFSESANALIKDVMAGHLDRNNLAVEVENGTSQVQFINHKMMHGELKSTNGNHRLGSVDPTGENVKPTVYELGCEAEGAGCNIGLVIQGYPKNVRFVVIAATPSNKDNYFKLHHSTTARDSTEEYWNDADKEDKHYSGDGYAHLTVDGFRVTALITGTSPATCFIEISDVQ